MRSGWLTRGIHPLDVLLYCHVSVIFMCCSAASPLTLPANSAGRPAGRPHPVPGRQELVLPFCCPIFGTSDSRCLPPLPHFLPPNQAALASQLASPVADRHLSISCIATGPPLPVGPPSWLELRPRLCHLFRHSAAPGPSSSGHPARRIKHCTGRQVSFSLTWRPMELSNVCGELAAPAAAEALSRDPSSCLLREQRFSRLGWAVGRILGIFLRACVRTTLGRGLGRGLGLKGC